MITNEQKKVLEQFSTSDLVSFIRNSRHTAFILWQTDDVIGTAKDYGFEMSEEDAQDVISGINSSRDCQYGITWETLRFHVDEWITENTFEVDIQEISTGEERTVKFCSLETNENIEDFWNDDEYYFYGTSKEEVAKYTGSEFTDGDCIIVKVD